MTPDAKRLCCWWAAAIMLMLALYAAMGVLQAGSIYSGERALQNLRLWGAVALVSLAGSGLFGFCAIRLRKTRPRQ